MKLFIYIIILLSSVCHAQTRSIVPQTPGQGSIGRTNKAWGTGYFNDIILNGTNLETRISQNNVFSFNGSTGDVEIVAGDGISITSTNGVVTVSFDPDGIPAVGTNRVYFQYTGYTNYWTVPAGITNIAVWAWGAGAGSFVASAYGGFSFANINPPSGSVLDIVVGQGGSAIGGSGNYTNFSYTRPSFGGGGRGWVGLFNNNAYGVSGGGGYSGVFYGTNVLIIAGGAGGANTGTSGGGVASGNGGGLSGGRGSGSLNGGGGTQISGGTIVTIPSLIGTNQPGSFLTGGDGGGDADGASGGGGGGGYFGGGGGVGQTSSSVGAGGGGSGYINDTYSSFGVTLRGTDSGVFGGDLPEYISGVGVRTALNRIVSEGGPGLIVIGY